MLYDIDSQYPNEATAFCYRFEGLTFSLAHDKFPFESMRFSLSVEDYTVYLLPYMNYSSRTQPLLSNLAIYL